MSRVAAGDAAAFRILVERHLPRGHAIARRVLHSEADAEDALQEAFTKVWVHAARWRPSQAAFSTWLYRIVVNTCLDAARRRRPEVGAEALRETLADEAAHAEALLGAEQSAERVRAAVQRLPVQQRMAVTLCYFEELTNPEAAILMSIHIKALEGLLVRARRSLRQWLPDAME
jgi:RNA polymerase sigma-70 factor (ECF subfamily)